MSVNFRRILTHLGMTAWQVRRTFPTSCLDAIEAAIRAAEAAHGGEICFVVEGALHGSALLHDVPARARALELFALGRVWDTEANNGVLIYVLLADRAVEIVADRHIHACAGDQAWQDIARAMESCFRAAEFETGALRGIEGVAAQLARHYPVRGATPNQLPDRPQLL